VAAIKREGFGCRRATAPTNHAELDPNNGLAVALHWASHLKN
jgi:hypothetical protein